ncbi:DNA repair protein RecO [Silvimonas sp. JCM 19000]
MAAPARSKRPRSGKSQPRIDAQPVFILHQYAYRETSRLLDIFSRDHGRLTVVARGAQRPGSQLRGVLMAFQPLLLSWFGGGEVKTLHAADWQGGLAHPVGSPLLCGFYINELLMRLLPREDPHPHLFAAYYEAVRQLSVLPTDAGAQVEPILRGFELALLSGLGYGLDFAHEVNGQAVLATRQYAFVGGQGFFAAAPGQGRFDGEVLLELASGKVNGERTLAQAKLLMRQALGSVLGEQPLHTRQLLLDLQRL